MNDFFYYSMIRSKRENTTKTRKLDNQVPVEELPNLMRAMGFYPTQQEVKNMQDEVRYSVQAEEGVPTTHVNIETFIKLFVNHRPVYGIGKNNISDAFDALINTIKDPDTKPGKILRKDLKYLLQNDGEEIGENDIERCLQLLVGEKNFEDALPEEVDADFFAEHVLGFEEVDENEME